MKLVVIYLVILLLVNKKISSIRTEYINGLSGKNCSSSHFACTNGLNHCIPLSWKCDHHPDCDDGSDEFGCAPCNENEMTCNDNKCISLGWVCDGDTDCSNGEDESPTLCIANNTCKYLGAPCRNSPNVCIKFNQLCNGVNDCPIDSSDEGSHCYHEFFNDNLNCSYAVTVLPSNVTTCYCPEGQILHTDNRTCKDADICLLTNPCAQICTNLNMGWQYKCSCENGFIPSPTDRRLCVLLSSSANSHYLIATNRLSIQKIFFNGSIWLSSSKAVNSTAMDYIFADNKVCWIYKNFSRFDSKLVCAGLDDFGISKEITLPGEMFYVFRLAIDWLTGNFYFLNGLLSRLSVCNVTSSPVCLVLDEVEVMAMKYLDLALDAYAGFLFYGVGGKYAKIIRMDMNGENKVAIVQRRIGTPTAIALDRYGQSVYMHDSVLGSLESFDYHGNYRKRLLHYSAIPEFSSFTYFNNSFYFWSTEKRTLIKLNPWFQQEESISVQTTDLLSLHAVHSTIQRPDFNHGCKSLKCDHLCLLGRRINNQTSGSCFCADGYTLESDGRTCKSPSKNQPFLLYSKSYLSEIKATSLDPLSSPDRDFSRFSVRFVEDAHTMDYYRDQNGANWLVVANRNKPISNSQIQFPDRMRECSSLAVDWLNFNLYWVDDVYKAIRMTPLEKRSSTSFTYFNLYNFDPSGLDRRTLFEEEVMRPKTMALLPSKGFMYWAMFQFLGPGRIERSWMDGSHREVFLSENRISFITAVTIDEKRDVLYWTDSYYDTIQSINLNKRGKKVLFSETFPRGELISHPVSISFFENNKPDVPGVPVGRYLYWVEYRKGRINRLDLLAQMKNHSKDVIQSIVTDTPPLFSSLVFDPLRRTGISVCQNRSCSDFCAPIPSPPFYKCLCPDSKILASDNKTCQVNHNYTAPGACPRGYFHCKNNYCVINKYVCDGDNDCRDNSDEDNHMCSNFTCADEKFYCNSSRTCISSSWVCDGDRDCSGGEDESFETCKKQTCPPSHFQCPSGECILRGWLCDDDHDCTDGADETANCPLSSCNPGAEFTCHNGRCISIVWLCDGDDDCDDGSDEENCRKATPSSAPTSVTNTSTCLDPDDVVCSDGVDCVPKEWRCDGDDDCGDQSDEKECENMPCRPHARRCATGAKCIFASWWCDGEVECPDGSDESNCTCPFREGQQHRQIRCFTSSYFYTCVAVCDGIRDCVLGNDEVNCTVKGPTCADQVCSHTCRDTERGVVCSCPKGKELAADERTCRDISYCSRMGVCSQNCTGSGSLYHCSCYPGWHIDRNDPRRDICAYDKTYPRPYIIYSTQHAIKYFALDDNLRPFLRHSHVLRGNLRHGLSLGFHYDQMLLFYVDFNKKTISKASVQILHDTNYISGKTLELVPHQVIVTKQRGKLEGLSVDWIAGRVYFVDLELHQIEVMTLDGTHRSVLVAGIMDNPRALCLDPRYGLMFWTVWDKDEDESCIERASMDGTNRTAIWKGSGWPNGLTLDYIEERVYWAVAKANAILSSLYDGSDVVLILSNVDWLSHPFALTTYAHLLFWTDWTTTVIGVADKWPNRNTTILELVHQPPYDIKVFHETRQPRTFKGSNRVIENPCLHDLCSHLCVIAPGSDRSITFRCVCPLHYELEEDQRTCKELTSFLLFSEPSRIVGRRLENLNFSAILGVNFFRPSIHPRIAYDALRKQVYWTQETPPEIKRSYLNGTGIETVVGIDSIHVDGLVVDWLRGLIFWTSHKNAQFGARLHVATNDGRFQRRLDGIDSISWRTTGYARYLTADVPAGVLYFAGDSAIYSVNMDGSSIKKIRDVDHVSDLHFHNGSLYIVSDSNVVRLHHCNSSWCAEKIKLSVSVSQLAVSNDRLLWIYDAQYIYNCSLGTPASCERRTKVLMISDLVIFDSDLQNRSNLENLPCSSGNSGCSQICLPSFDDGSHGKTCQCTDGFKPDHNDSSLCIGVDEFLVFSSTSRISGINLRNDTSTLVSVVDQWQSVGVDFYAENDTIIWAESGKSSLKAALRNMTSKWLIYSAYDGNEEQRKAATSSSFRRYEGLAVDWMAKNLYWVDALFKEVKVVRMDGLYPFTVYKGVPRMRGLAVHPGRAFLFVCSWLFSRSITRMNLDGSDPVKVVRNAGWPNGLTIDYVNNRLYWCDALHGQIRSSNLNGRGIRIVYSSTSGHKYGISYFNGRLFWSDNILRTGSIYSCPVESCTKANLTLLASGLGITLKDVAVYSPKRQTGANVCSRNNGGCEQLCFYLGSNSRRCACSHGRLNDADNTTCLPWSHFLFFSTQSQIHSINVVNPKDLNGPFPLLESNLVKSVVVMAADYNNKRVFYSDMSEGTISVFSVPYNKSHPPRPSVILEDIGTVEGLAYHLSENALYWTSFDDQSVKKYLLSSPQNNTTVVVPRSNSSDKLRALVLFECERPNLIFWTNWNEDDPSILRANTDGSNKTKVVWTSIRTPNGLALDRVTKELYWADAMLDKIERCNFDGKNRKVIVATGLEHVFSLALMGEFLYWSDWRRDELLRANKWTGTEKELLREFTFTRLMGVLAFYNDTCVANPCHGQCQYSCVVSIEGEATCMCPDGSLSNHCDSSSRHCPSDRFNCLLDSRVSDAETNCIPYELTCNGRSDCPNRADESPHYCNTRVCKNGTWLCSNNDRCIARDLVCDGFDNCMDGFASDERDCPKSLTVSVTESTMLCRPGLFQCAHKISCIPMSYVCDHETDCQDGSDEANCSSSGCKESYFACASSSLCIPFQWVCDHEDDCHDLSDEASCDENLCRKDQFECASTSECIDAAWQCDRDRDCEDGSDEMNCRYPPCVGFLCDGQQTCVKKDFVCDGDLDCLDGTDERDCPTAAPTRCDSINDLVCPDTNQCLPRSRACDGVEDCRPPIDEQNCNLNECDDPDTNKCPQICVEAVYSYTCKCYDGYQLDRNNSYSCLDIDECSEALPYPPCSQICTNVKGSYICSCTTGYRRDQADSTNCLAQPSYPEPFAIFSMGKSLVGVDLKKIKNRHRRLFTRSGHVIGLDFDWLEQFIYWADVRKHGAVIGRIDLSNRTAVHANGSVSFREHSGAGEVILDNLPTVHSIAVDWLARNLYWTELETKSISVSKLDGRFKKILIQSGIRKPRAVAVDPRKGFLFWTDWGEQPHIGRSGMDGSQRIVLISNQSSIKVIRWPNALTIDYASKRLFWADAVHQYIASCAYDGTTPRIVPLRPSHSSVVINALAVFQDLVYWNDWADKSIKYTRKFSGTSGDDTGKLGILEHSLNYQPMNLKIVHPLLQPMQRNPHPCSINNGGCEDLCLIVPGGTYRCECPDNFHLSINQRSCLSNCSYVEFTCKNHKCLPYWKKCDGVDDCGDNSDEPENCRPFYCSPGQYQCPESTRDSYKCISPSALCDGIRECPKGMDEFDCVDHVCLHNQFKCDKSKPPRCVPMTYRCNGAIECDRGEDESDCAIQKCSESDYKCKPVSTGSNRTAIKCVPQKWVCDGEADCDDGDDEDNCKPESCEEGMYKCPDGPCIPISAVRDNEPDCPDGTDETADSCVVCPELLSLCVPADWLCNGVKDCINGEDEADCRDSSRCASDSFICVSDGKCIDRALVCDDEFNCEDGSDEKECGEVVCDSSQFRCVGTRVCVPDVLRCNGIADCVNATDEQNCRGSAAHCTPDMFQCKDGACIPPLWVCDGQSDCFDFSDEGDFCAARNCSVDRPFRCGGICLSLKKICDGWNDCLHQEDETKNCFDDPSYNNKIIINSSHCLYWPGFNTSARSGFVCPDNSCISLTSLCNDVADCPSGYDEGYCNKASCSDSNLCSGLPNSVCVPLPPEASGGPYTSYCRCKKGFVARAAGRLMKCADVDECKESAPCSQTCLNTVGSYQCICDDGWRLFNKTGCRYDYKATFVITTASPRLQLRVFKSIEKEFRYAHEMEFNAFNLSLSRLVSADMGHTIFGSDLSDGIIYKMTESIVTKIVQLPPGHKVSGLSIDETGSNLFWVDSIAGSVSMMKVKSLPQATKHRRSTANRRHLVLFNRNNSVLHRPLDVAVQHYSDNIFVSNWDVEFIGAIYKFNLKSKTSKHTLLASDIGWPKSLSVDLLGMRLYWSDAKTKTISSCLFDGSARHTIIQLPFIKPNVISVFGDFVFVSILELNTVVRIDKLSRPDPQVSFPTPHPLVHFPHGSYEAIVYAASRPVAFLIIHHPLYPQGSLKECQKCCSGNSGGFCLYNSGNYACMCRDAPDHGFRRCESECADGNCAACGNEQSPTADPVTSGFIVFFVILLLGLGVVIVLMFYKKSFPPTRFCRRLINRSQADVRDMSYRQLILADSLATSHTSIDNNSSDVDGAVASPKKTNNKIVEMQEFFGSDATASQERAQLLRNDLDQDIAYDDVITM